MKVDKPGIYKVTVTDVCGSAATEVKITNDYCDIYFPSGFTPDKNGLNDLFKPITNLKLPYFRLSIYNRWGEQIFQTMDVTKGWDGKIRGMNADAGVFIWYCEFKRPGATEIKSVKGTFILVR
jgi:gliding motility-associated-like protein